MFDHDCRLQASPGEEICRESRNTSTVKFGDSRIKKLFSYFFEVRSEARSLGCQFTRNCFLSLGIVGAILGGGEDMIEVTDELCPVRLKALFAEEPPNFNKCPDKMPVRFLSVGKNPHKGIAFVWLPTTWVSAGENPGDIHARRFGDDLELGDISGIM